MDLDEVLRQIDEYEIKLGFSLQYLRRLTESIAANPRITVSARVYIHRLETKRGPRIGAALVFYRGLEIVEIVCRQHSVKLCITELDRDPDVAPSEADISLRRDEETLCASIVAALFGENPRDWISVLREHRRRAKT